MEFSSSSTRVAVTDPVQAEAMLAAIAMDVGREVRVFVRPAAITSQESSRESHIGEEEPEAFYEFTSEDYARLMASKKEDVYLKTRKIREQEAAVRRSKVTKAIIRVQFPDNYVLEANFKPADPVSLIFDMIKKLISHPELPFYIYTSPPKQRIKNLEQSMYDAGLAPGALLYFSYTLPKVVSSDECVFVGMISPMMDDAEAHRHISYLRDDVAALKDLHLVSQTSSKAIAPSTEVNLGTDADAQAMPDSESIRPAMKRQNVKPKWLKLSSK